eukprot:m.317243 g.317243  ORF g.317243 m.317243 type:complete len:223 (-) comp19685_c0_seq11:139-807(-)
MSGASEGVFSVEHQGAMLDCLGKTTAGIPEFARHDGRVPDANLSEVELRMVVGELWHGWMASIPDGSTMPFDAFVTQQFATDFDDPAQRAMWATNVYICSQRRRDSSADVLAFCQVCNGEVDSAVYRLFQHHRERLRCALFQQSVAAGTYPAIARSVACDAVNDCFRSADAKARQQLQEALQTDFEGEQMLLDDLVSRPCSVAEGRLPTAIWQCTVSGWTRD